MDKRGKEQHHNEKEQPDVIVKAMTVGADDECKHHNHAKHLFRAFCEKNRENCQKGKDGKQRSPYVRRPAYQHDDCAKKNEIVGLNETICKIECFFQGCLHCDKFCCFLTMIKPVYHLQKIMSTRRKTLGAFKTPSLTKARLLATIFCENKTAKTRFAFLTYRSVQ